MIFDLHIHSKYSKFDSVSEVKDIVARAKRIGLDGIAVSDHNEIKGALEALSYSSDDFMVIPATEVSSADGHIVALGVKEIVERDLPAKETIELIHSAGGIAIAAHPYDKFRHGVKDLCWKLDFNAIEINGHCLVGNSQARRIAREKGKPLVGGSDAHAISGIGSITTKVDAKDVDDLLGKISKGECSYVIGKNKLVHKVSIVADKISRKYGISRKL
ncbi:MAG: PHP domain-containing protein [Candidatus Altiarchaeota archaeon]|nr:PHP domain-containing protein [Candidatus Altiarchaeota archaeon]